MTRIPSQAVPPDALDADIARRYRALHEWAERAAPVPTGRAVELLPAAATAATTATTTAAGHPRQRIPLRPLAAAAAVLVMLGGGATLLLRGPDEPGRAQVQQDPARPGPQSSPDGIGPTVDGVQSASTKQTPPPPSATPGRPGTPTDWTPASVVKAGLAGTAPSWGRALPPAGAVLSRAYALATTASDAGYRPRSGECAATVHARYWTWGPDGKVYPTWHPAKDPSGCTFGHDHGADPRTANLFAAVGWPAFGYADEMLSPDDPAGQRNSSHVGYKVEVLNQVATHPGNNVNLAASQVCDAYLAVHQETSTADAFASTLHELFYNVRCRHTDDGSVTEAHLQLMVPIGQPGEFTSVDACDGSGTTLHRDTGTPSPAGSPGGGGVRKLADADCAAKVVAGDGDIGRIQEMWTFEVHAGGQGGLARLDLNPFAVVLNPARYYDPAAPGRIGHTIDLCYRGAKGAACDTVRAITASTGAKVAWDDPRSPFDGTRRRLNPNFLGLVNTGPSVLYSDVYGRRWETAPFAGSIRQFLSGSHNDTSAQGDLFLGGDVAPHEIDYGSDPLARVRVPN